MMTGASDLLARDECREFLTSAPLFQELAPEAIERLRGELGYRHLFAGEILFRRGEPGDCLYIVMNGWLRVFVEGEDGAAPKVIGELGRGEVVGEMALITDDPRSASVGAIRDSDLVSLSRSGFERLIEQYPRSILELLRHIVERIREAADKPAHKQGFRTIAIVPVGEACPLEAFAERFCSSLSDFGKVRAVDARDAGQVGGAGGLVGKDATEAGSPLTSWLTHLEQESRFVVYLAGPTPDPWTQCCVRQADRILYVVKADSPVCGTPVEGIVEGRSKVLGSPRRDLALLHDAAAEPRGTEAWLNRVSVDLHHHATLSERGGIGRLVRILVGRAHGLVLSGGGARGFAHLGVCRALEDFRVPVDMVGGTSMGSIMAGGIAMGLGANDAMANCMRRFSMASNIHDYTFPFFSIMRCREVERQLDRVFGDLRIEDLWLPYFCVSTNITEAALRIHQRGPLSRAIRASISLPGLFPPVPDSGSILIDGAIMNNLPADIMRDICDGVIIGVDVGTARTQRVPETLAEFPSPYAGLWSILGRKRRTRSELPTILHTIWSSVGIGSAYNEERITRYVDFLLRPDVSGYGLTDWHLAGQIAEHAYEWAKPQVEAWLESQERAVKSPGP